MDSSLPVVQAKQSHALKLDPDQIPDSDSFTLAIAPYPEMAIKDKVTLTWQGWFGENTGDEPWEHTETVQDVGQALRFELSSTHVVFLHGGFAEMSYRVDYANDQPDGESPVQRLDIAPPCEERLPAASIASHSGSVLYPEDFPEGATLEIVAWRGIELNDDVLLYASSTRFGQEVVKGLRVNQPMLDAGKLAFTLEQAWLQGQLNETITFMWQYARLGVAESSTSLTLQVLAAWRPNAPIIDDALPEPDSSAPNQGYIDARFLRGGGVVRIPLDVGLGDNDQAQVHWQGYGTSGHYIAEHADPDDPHKFAIPSAAVPANMGKRLNVLYTITRPDQPLATSKPFDLRVVPLENFPTVQCAHVDLNQLQLGLVPSEGALLTLLSWTFMAAKQTLNIRAESSKNLDVLKGFVVTGQHVTDKKVTAYLSREYLASLTLGARLTIKVGVSFDEGHSYTAFPALQLIMAA